MGIVAVDCDNGNRFVVGPVADEPFGRGMELAQWPQLGGAFALGAGICVAAGDRALGAGAQYARNGCKTSLQLASSHSSRFERLGDVWRFLRFR